MSCVGVLPHVCTILQKHGFKAAGQSRSQILTLGHLYLPPRLEQFSLPHIIQPNPTFCKNTLKPYNSAVHANLGAFACSSTTTISNSCAVSGMFRSRRRCYATTRAVSPTVTANITAAGRGEKGICDLIERASVPTVLCFVHDNTADRLGVNVLLGGCLGRG